jgi:hypothetical protein
VTKLNADGTTLLYSTFLGGSDSDIGQAIATDVSGASLVTGYTLSTDFPTIPGAYGTSFNGGLTDAFVAKLSSDGASLLYSTFLGRSGGDGGNGIAVEADGAALITGTTGSSDFPTTPGAYDTTFNGDEDAFVAKLSADGSSLLYATFLGGSLTDFATGITVDATGMVFVTGITGSSDFPTTSAAYDGIHNGDDTDSFVAKLSADGSTLQYSTFLGGDRDDGARSIAVDASGAAFITGSTSSSNFPTTPGAFDTTFGGGPFDAFMAKLNADGSSLLYSTFLGGAGPLDGGSGIVLDASGAALVTGDTTSLDFPTTPGAYDTTLDGGADVFVVKIVTACAPGSWTNYGTGWPGTNGIPSLTAIGDPILCTTLAVDFANSLGASTVALLMIGFQATDQPTAYGGHRLVVPASSFLVSLPAAGLALSGPLPCDESLCGLAVYAQALEIDGGASKGVSFTPGLELRLGVQ